MQLLGAGAPNWDSIEDTLAYMELGQEQLVVVCSLCLEQSTICTLCLCSQLICAPVVILSFVFVLFPLLTVKT